MLQLPVSPRSRRVRVSAATTAAIVAVSLLGVSPASAVPNATPSGADGPLPVVSAGHTSTSPSTAETSTITETSTNDTTTTGTTTMTTPPESPGPDVLTLDWTGTPSARNVATPAAREQQIPLDGCGAHGLAAATAKARALVRQIRSDLAAVEDEIRNAPFIGAVESGAVPVEQIAAVACRLSN